MEVDVYSFDKPEKKSLTLDKEFFDIPLNQNFLYQVIRAQNLNLKKSTAHTKTRGEVRGGGKKPWSQKYTGRARHGSIRSPLWVGGGVVFGPRNEKSYFKKINRKSKNKALFMALSAKLRDKEVVFIEDINLNGKLKTKDFLNKFKDFVNRIFQKDFDEKQSYLIITPVPDFNLKRVSANKKNIQVISSQSVSALLILSKKYIIILKDAISELLKRRFKTSKS